MKKLSFLLTTVVVIVALASLYTSAYGKDKYSVSGEIAFLEEEGQFSDVPKGEYGIVCIHDLNMNGKLDFGHSDAPIAIEPYVFWRPLVYEGVEIWDDVSFKVDKEISGIEVKF